MQTYLYLNCVLYAIFAVWCTVSASTTAANLGYLSLSSGGRSEYLVIYGGLQLGLAFLFGVLAGQSAYWRLGMIVSIGLYAPIVAYRVITVGINWPVAGLTLATGVLEAGLLAAAVILFVRGGT